VRGITAVASLLSRLMPDAGLLPRLTRDLRPPYAGLLAQDVAEDAPALAREVSLSAGELFLGPLRHNREGDQLRMRVRERRSGLPAVVAKQQQVLEPGVPVEVAVPLAVHPQRRRELVGTHDGGMCRMLGRLDDDLVGADTAHALEQAVHPEVGRAFDAQRGV